MSDDPTIDVQPHPESVLPGAVEPEPTIGNEERSGPSQLTPINAVAPDSVTIDQPTSPNPNPNQSVDTVPVAPEVLTGAWNPSQPGTEDVTGEYAPSGDPTSPQEESPKAGTTSQRTLRLPGGGHASRFLLKKFHARGGMGEVWIAEDTEIGRVVALKKIRSGRQTHVDKFLHEAQITGQLEHPGVVPVHELGVDGAGQPYYVMKFVHGRTLKDAIDDYHNPEVKSAVPREVQLVELLQVFIHLCQTVAYAHSRNVIHRDLKPDNVMVGQYGETLVLDWGLAKVVGQGGGTETMPEVRLSGFEGTGEVDETQFGSIKGTPSYMSPEVAEGRTNAVDQISDVYLLGGCLYHLLTGRKPRQAAKVAEMIELARKQLPPAPRKLDSRVPKVLDAICMKALALDKQERYASAQTLAQDIQRYLAGEPVTAYRETLAERAWRWIRKHRVGLGRAAVVALIVGLVASGSWLLMEAEAKRQEDLRQKDLEAQAILAKAAADKDVADRKNKALAEENLRQERIKRAQEDLKKLHQLAEEMQFFNVMYDNSADKEPLYGSAEAEARGRAGVAALAEWGPNLDTLPLDRERGGARTDLYELLLNLVQLMVQSDNDPETAKEAGKFLDRAEGRTLSHLAAYYRLRGQVHHRLGEAAKASDAMRKATEKSTPRPCCRSLPALANTYLAEADPHSR